MKFMVTVYVAERFLVDAESREKAIEATLRHRDLGFHDSVQWSGDGPVSVSAEQASE